MSQAKQMQTETSKDGVYYKLSVFETHAQASVQKPFGV